MAYNKCPPAIVPNYPNYAMCLLIWNTGYLDYDFTWNRFGIHSMEELVKLRDQVKSIQKDIAIVECEIEHKSEYWQIAMIWYPSFYKDPRGVCAKFDQLRVPEVLRSDSTFQTIKIQYLPYELQAEKLGIATKEYVKSLAKPLL